MYSLADKPRFFFLAPTLGRGVCGFMVFLQTKRKGFGQDEGSDSERSITIASLESVNIDALRISSDSILR